MQSSWKWFGLSVAMMLWVTDARLAAYGGIVAIVEPPGAVASTVPGVTTETFDSFALGQYANLTTAVGTLSTAGAMSIVTADQWGGAGGTGLYFGLGAESGSADPVTLAFGGPQSYFGMWWSAADANNMVQFYSGSTLVATYTMASAFAGLDSAYYGNPGSPGVDLGESFAYFDFYGTDGTTFTSAVLSNAGTTGTGFEADNFSVVTAVSEPSALALYGMAIATGGLLILGRRSIPMVPAVAGACRRLAHSNHGTTQR
jgi:hypothetical protein